MHIVQTKVHFVIGKCSSWGLDILNEAQHQNIARIEITVVHRYHISS